MVLLEVRPDFYLFCLVYISTTGWRLPSGVPVEDGLFSPFFIAVDRRCGSFRKYEGVFVAGKLEVLCELVEPIVKSLGCVLWGVEFVSQGKQSQLRVFIDKGHRVSNTF